MASCTGELTFLISRKTEEDIPAVYQHHVICQVLALNFNLLHDNNVGLQNVEHGRERPRLIPWRVSKRISDPIHVPGRDAQSHCVDW